MVNIMFNLKSWRLVFKIRKVLKNNDVYFVDKLFVENRKIGSIYLVSDDNRLRCDIEPRRLRIFDKISLNLCGVDVFLPLVPRLILRRFVRNFLINLSHEEISAYVEKLGE